MTAPAPQSETIWTVGRLLAWTADFFARGGLEDARLCAEVLLAHAAGCKRIELYVRFDQALPPDATTRFRELVRRAAAHEPIAYLVGDKEFFSLSFAVGPGVLIPRPETETLVEAVLDHLSAAGVAEPRLLDVGTGSGCIAVAVLKQLPAARAVATDVSAEALSAARANAERHGLADRLTVVEADRLNLPQGAAPQAGFDVLMSNPPYIAKGAMAGLPRNVRDHEPPGALTDGADGLSFYRALAAGGAALLAPGGIVAVEMGAGQAEAVRGIFEAGGWRHQATRSDRTTGRERVMMFAR